MQFSRLKELRLDKGVTQQSVSNATQISRSVLSQYENGVAEPTASVVVKLAQYFSVSTDYLLGRTDELGAVITPLPTTDNYTDEEKKLIADYRELTPPLKRMIQETLKTWKSSEINTKKLS